MVRNQNRTKCITYIILNGLEGFFLVAFSERSKFDMNAEFSPLKSDKLPGYRGRKITQ